MVFATLRLCHMVAMHYGLLRVLLVEIWVSYNILWPEIQDTFKGIVSMYLYKMCI